MPRYGQRTLAGTNRKLASQGKAPAAGVGYGSATGGIGAPTAVTINSVNFQYLQFNSTGTLTVTKAGFFDYLAVGGGGSPLFQGGTSKGGGGGSGCLRIGSVFLSANQTITIGGGAAPVVNGPSVGADTVIAATSPFSQTAPGNLSTINNNIGTTELFIGGGFGAFSSVTSYTTSLGFKGGTGDSTTAGGGGGGFTAVGGNASGTTGGQGGAGFDVSVFIGGSALHKAMGGGGGGSVTGGAAATNGVAGTTSNTQNAGNANSGGGAGAGHGTSQTGGTGGSGIVYIRFGV